jgi:hypothetical protein
MAELKIYLSDILSEKFRRIAMSVFGYGRGSLSRAAEEALTKWCSEHEPSLTHGESRQGTDANQGIPSRETESHINPDERENMRQNAKGPGEDKTLTPTGSST